MKIISFFKIFAMCITFLYSYVSFNTNKKITPLFGKVIFVDAGHGGKDNGSNYDGVLEDEINFNIAFFIIEILIGDGANVYSSRDGDYDLSNNYDRNKKQADLKKRVGLINSINPDIFISIHLNSYESSNVRGAHVFYQNNDYSMKAADYIQRILNDITGIKKKKKPGDYFILNKSNAVGVLIECGFLSNYEDRMRLLSEDYQRQIARGIVKGIEQYLTNV